jgi:menaquinol-cytochrome c reductase iron-sulfur subunit
MEKTPIHQPSFHRLSRRDFIVELSLGVAALSAAMVAVPVANALIAPLIHRRPHSWHTVGRVDDFPIGSTRLVKYENGEPEPSAGMPARWAVWLRRKDRQTFAAFAVSCTHLGCAVRWIEDAGLFVCPCHGGIYYGDGSVAAGPPPRRLPEYRVRVRNNEVQVQPGTLP